MFNNHFSQNINVFQGRGLPENGILVGYAALINNYYLNVPIPEKLSLISEKHKRYETDDWMVFTPRHKPKDSLGGHLAFAIKYEGIDLYLLKTLFKKISQSEIENIIKNEPTGKYSRRIWFLYEWLLDTRLNIPNVETGNYIDLLDSELQYPGPSENSKRHHIRNNLPGVKNFCPLIRRTEKLNYFKNLNLSKKIETMMGKIEKEIFLRASAFLLLKDSKASYAIEGEIPPQNRAQRWGMVIGQAGENPLSSEEFIKLQQIVIENKRFVKMGWRKQGGFVGDHERETGAPIPVHISAKWQDIEILINGLIETSLKLFNTCYDPVLAAALVAFGFVFIHPFVDGNGRIHRYLIHYGLAKMNFTPKGIFFPVSSAIFKRISKYSEVLKAFSIPRLPLIEWKQTIDNNIEVLNDTTDLYRYFDATKQAEFLYECILDTIETFIPEEVTYLYNFENFKNLINKKIILPDKMISLLVRFLEQGKGTLSKRVLQKEFKNLSQQEVLYIEKSYRDSFLTPNNFIQ